MLKLTAALPRTGAMRATNLFKGFGIRARSAPGDNQAIAEVILPSHNGVRLEILDDFEKSGLVWMWAGDAEGNLIYVSQSAAEGLGHAVTDLLGRHLTDLFETDPDNPNERSDRSFNFQISARNRITDLIVRLAPGGALEDARQSWWMICAHPKFDESGQFVGYRGTAKDVTVEYERKVHDKQLAQYDSLTGLANRHRLNKRLDTVLSAYKAAKRHCALMMLDLDRFKHVNDTLGHQAGDELLKQAGDRLKSIVGSKGEIGRLGGDEFEIILPDIDDRGVLGELAERIIQMLAQPYSIGGQRARVGASVGIAIAPYDGLERSDMMKSADMALYAAKNAGRSQFRFYSADLKDKAEERRQLMEDLREALSEDGLELHYQPVVRVEDDMVVSFEALIRWDHPERGPVSPAVFIPIAEESNLIIQLGEWALRRACMDAAKLPDSVKIAVNVSALQFSSPAFPEIISNAINDAGLGPDRLELELTESVFMGGSETIDDTFKALKDAGVRLALDDFGTGYSSLSYLRAAPFDKIKVDKSFVDNCTDPDQNSAKIITAIIGLSSALNMDVVVEGVEAFDQLELVKQQGARFVQGWIYAKAMPFQEIVAMMASGQLHIEPDGPARYRSDRRTVFRRIGIIHEDHRYTAVMRDLSRTDARIEGVIGIFLGSEVVLDFGNGQLAVCIVTRSHNASITVEFETPLVNDGSGGLCTRHRVSPYALAAAGLPLEASTGSGLPMQLVTGGGETAQDNAED